MTHDTERKQQIFLLPVFGELYLSCASGRLDFVARQGVCKAHATARTIRRINCGKEQKI